MIIKDTYHHYYVTSDWTPEFYRVLACAGFISVAQEEYLIPEIQTYYCILDFPLLHIPKKTKKIARRYLKPHHPSSGVASITNCVQNQQNQQNQLQPELRLRMYANRNSALCIRKIQEYWGEENWLNDRYVACLQASGLKVYTFELYLEAAESGRTRVSASGTGTGAGSGVNVGAIGSDQEEKEKEKEGGGDGYSHTLLAGEVGYVIGGVYTSLTGFHMGGNSSAADVDASSNSKKREKKKEGEDEKEKDEQPHEEKAGEGKTADLKTTDDGAGGQLMTLSKDLFFFPSSSASSSAPLSTTPKITSTPLLLPKDLARCCGTIQLVALGSWLQASGFSFWNLG